MRAVDTNVLVRLLVRDDPDQVEVAESFIAPGAWISHLVLIEAVWVLATVYDRTTPQLVTSVEILLNHKQLAIQDMETVVSALELFRKRPTLGFSDCLVLEVARKAGHVPLGTFDRNLSKVEGARRLD